MKRKPLGNTGIEVSEVAFGGVEIGLPYGIGIAGKEDMLSKSDAINLLHAALDRGINFFDTARMYGESEDRIGKAFQHNRQEVIIATKCRHFRGSNGNIIPDEELPGFIQTSLEESLKILKTDYIDIFMLHQADLEILENAVIESVFQQLKASGKIRATGVSTYSVAETDLAIQKGSWDVIQLPFNLLDQTHAACFGSAAANGTGIIVRSVLMKGLLSDRGKNLHPALSAVEKHIELYEQIVREYATDLPTLATQFALSFPEVSSVLVGIDKLDYLIAACKTVENGKLRDEVMARARQLSYPEPSFLNLPYWDKMGWLT